MIRLRIHTEGAPKLRDLPWEHLCEQNTPKPLALTPTFSIVRYPDLPLPLVKQNVRLPIKILVAISSPVDAPRLNVQNEMRKLRHSLTRLIKEKLVDVEYIPNCTREKLRAKLIQPKTVYHIVHFIGHGGFSETKQEGAIYLEDHQSRAVEVTGADLAPMFLNNNVSLVFFNMCDTARPSITNPFAAPAEFLVRRGIPCVIGMQFPISDDAAIAFSSVFYRELASGSTLDECVQKGRQQIEQSTNVPEWGTPVLFMRTAQDHLFQLAQPAKTGKKGTKRKKKMSDPTDPFKGFANGKSKNNSRKITASIKKEKGYEAYHYVTLRVASTDPKKPLRGNVVFHLHPSFQFPRRIVKVVDGVATLDITAYGAFTVGAEADDGKTKLELDLLKVPGAEKLFYES